MSADHIAGAPGTPATLPADAAPRFQKRTKRRLKAQLRSLDDLDFRTVVARRAREMIATLTSDLGGDLTSAQTSLVRRAAMLSTLAEHAEVSWLSNQAPIVVGDFCTVVNTLNRVLITLGIGRVPHEIDAAPQPSHFDRDWHRELEAKIGALGDDEPEPSKIDEPPAQEE
jgi:hypothetical protein